MKKVCILCVVLLMTVLTSCQSKFVDADLNVPKITVTSTSINSDGRLLTESAADKSPNSPLGSNKSPQLSWDAVEGASCYAVCMFDEDANWLHWLVTDIQKTSLQAGEYTAKNQYVGPYPPKIVGRHHYRIEVFALKQEPDKVSGKMDSSESYKTIVDSLNVVGGRTDNILARGNIIGTYANGDTTVNGS